jgi:hypothetical protein
LISEEEPAVDATPGDGSVLIRSTAKNAVSKQPLLLPFPEQLHFAIKVTVRVTLEFLFPFIFHVK